MEAIHYKSLSKSLAFERSGAPGYYIKNALQGTCDWLFRHQTFQEWFSASGGQRHNGILWIKGKPGCGKSTLMKTALQWTRKQVSKTSKETIILNYFFDSQAHSWLEKSSLGFYRSLIHQILRTSPSSRNLFMTRFASKEVDNGHNPWTENELQGFLREIVTSAKQYNLIIFVDALDESEREEDVRQMINFLTDLADQASNTSCQLRICISSRHYPHVRIERGLSLVPEDQIEHDLSIEKYVERQLIQFNDGKHAELRAQICKKSHGNFLWLVLVVAALNQMFNQGHSITLIRTHLDSIPPDLNELFAGLTTDAKRSTESLHLLQWMCFSMRSLQLQELYLGIKYSCVPAAVWSSSNKIAIPSADILNRYIIHQSKGLVELTSSSPSVVRFLHATVLGFTKFSYDSDLSASLSHEALKLGCDRYISANTIPSDLGRYVIETYIDQRSLSDRLQGDLSFIRYAVSHVFDHAEHAQRLGVSQGTFLSSQMDENGMWVGPIMLWWNALERYKIRKYAQVTLIYFLADRTYPYLLKAVLGISSTVNTHCGRYGSALQAACRAGNPQIVSSLIDHGADIDKIGGEYPNALQAASIHGHSEIVQILLQGGADFNARSRHRTALYQATTHGRDKVVRMLVDHGADVNASGGELGTALQAALKLGHQNIVQILVDSGAVAQGREIIDTEIMASEATTSAVANVEATDCEISEPTAVPTDSGFWSMEQPLENYDAKRGIDEMSVYSVDSAVDADVRRQLIDDFAGRLMADLDLDQVTQATFGGQESGLSDLFLDFALSIGYDNTLESHLEIAKFIRQYRSGLARAFGALMKDASSDISSKNDEQDNDDITRPDGPQVSVSEKMQMWQNSNTIEFTNVEIDVLDLDHLDADPSPEPSPEPSIFNKLEGLVYNSFAYRLLVATMRRQFVLTETDPSVFIEFRETIHAAFRKPKRIGRKVPIPACHAIFEVVWPLRSFLDDQVPDWRKDGGIDHILTITGGLVDAQADTCAKYVNKTWPLIGEDLLRVVNDFLIAGNYASLSRPGYLNLSASDKGLDLIRFEVDGARGAVVEVGEQLCWLSSALRNSVSDSGIQKYVPRLVFVETNERPGTNSARDNSNTSSLSKITFSSGRPTPLPKAFIITHYCLPMEGDDLSNGTCWYALFQKATMVGGFPISTRSNPFPGLEIPLSIAADLIGIQHVTHFDNISRLKGHSAMLYPTKQDTDTVLWHLDVSQGKRAVSYLDRELSSFSCEKPAELYKRHVVGWSESTINLVGTAACSYDIHPANAKPIAAGHAFNQCTLAPASLLPDDGPFRVPRDYYRQSHRSTPLPAMMQTLGSRSVCFWDEPEQRGWLVGGIAALAHLVRASVECDQNLPGPLLPHQSSQFEEPESPYAFDSPGQFLCNPSDWKKTLLSYQHEGEQQVETLENRASHFYELLDQAFYYQDSHRRDLKRSTRKKLECWDFRSLVWRRNERHRPLHIKLTHRGMSWIDLLRDVKIPTFCGSNFGELMRPGTDGMQLLCSKWRTLPTNEYYLAASAAVLSNIMSYAGGGIARRPRRLTRSLNWIAPGQPFGCCGCRDENIGNHHVQVILQRKLDPPWTSNVTCNLSAANLPHNSLVVFGHNDLQDWHWPETGQPQKGRLEVPAVVEDPEEFDSSTDESVSGDVISSEVSQTLKSPLLSMTTNSTEEARLIPQQKSYGSSAVKGKGRMHQGDNNVYNTTNNYTNCGIHAGMPHMAFYQENTSDVAGERLLPRPDLNSLPGPRIQSDPRLRLSGNSDTIPVTSVDDDETSP